MKKVVLFGAGQVGAMTARLLGPDYMIVCAADNSPEKWETELAGIPVIAATGSCLEEAGGSSALYTDPRNEQELRGLIESVLNEPKLAESMRSGGRENIRRFMPDVLAAHFMRVYENISRS